MRAILVKLTLKKLDTAPENGPPTRINKYDPNDTKANAAASAQGTYILKEVRKQRFLKICYFNERMINE